jgi:ABC-type branched-subunit amino acid transport system substrate-binding protein
MEGFIAARVLTEGLRRSGSNPSGSSLMKALETISDFDLGGFVVNFGPGNRSGSKYIDIGVLSAKGTLHY